MIARVRLTLTRCTHRLFRHSSTGPRCHGRHCATPARRRTATDGPTGGTTGGTTSAGNQQARSRDVAVGGAAEMEAKLAQVEADLRARGLVTGTVYRNHMHHVGVVSAPGITVWVLLGQDGVLWNRDVLQECIPPAAGPMSSSPVDTGTRPPLAHGPAYGDQVGGFLDAGTVRDSRSRRNGRPPLRPVA